MSKKLFLALKNPAFLSEKALPGLLKAPIITYTKSNAVIDVWMAEDFYFLLVECFQMLENTFRLIWWWTWYAFKDDEFNKEEHNMHQMMMFRPDLNWDHTLLWLYRYCAWKECLQSGPLHTPMSSLWDFSDDFMDKYGNSTVELWTAAINYSLKGTSKDKLLWPALFSMRTGLAGAVKKNEGTKYFVGKMTIPAQYNKECKELVLAYLERYYTNENPSAISKFAIASHPAVVLPEGLTWNYNEDSPKLKEKIKILSNWKESLPPWMFDIYLGRIPNDPGMPDKAIEYIWTVPSWWVDEAWIVVRIDGINEETQKAHFTPVDIRQKEHSPEEKFTFQDLLNELTQKKINKEKLNKEKLNKEKLNP